MESRNLGKKVSEIKDKDGRECYLIDISVTFVCLFVCLVTF